MRRETVSPLDQDLLVVSCRDVPRSPEPSHVSTLVGHHVAAVSVVDEVAPSESK